MRKEAYDAVKGYTEKKRLLRVEDYHLWIKMYEVGYRGKNIPKQLYLMRDDKAAYKRRKFRYRVNEAYVRGMAVRKLGLPISGYLYAIQPIIIGILPKVVYDYFHKRKLESNSKKNNVCKNKVIGRDGYMIPKKIHYCWFGKGKKSKLALKCIRSWRQYCPEYEVIEWNEENFDIDMNGYTRMCYAEKSMRI